MSSLSLSLFLVWIVSYYLMYVQDKQVYKFKLVFHIEAIVVYSFKYN